MACVILAVLSGAKHLVEPCAGSRITPDSRPPFEYPGEGHVRIQVSNPTGRGADKAKANVDDTTILSTWASSCRGLMDSWDM